MRPALEKFYNSLSDEQQARFNALGPNVGERSQQQPQQEANAQAESCGDPKSSLTSCRSNGSRPSIHPAGKQKEALDRLSAATKKAVKGLQSRLPGRRAAHAGRTAGGDARSGSRPCCRQPN